MKKFVLPVAVVILAVTSAFTTAESKSKVLLTFKQGYIQTPTACDISDMCVTDNGPLCRVGGGISTPVLWGLDASGQHCPQPLFKIPPQ